MWIFTPTCLVVAKVGAVANTDAGKALDTIVHDYRPPQCLR
jgi:hypothetical protein